mgnify:CR=1 FL=1
MYETISLVPHANSPPTPDGGRRSEAYGEEEKAPLGTG